MCDLGVWLAWYFLGIFLWACSILSDRCYTSSECSDPLGPPDPLVSWVLPVYSLESTQITQAQGYKCWCRHPYGTCQKVPSEYKSFSEYCKFCHLIKRLLTLFWNILNMILLIVKKKRSLKSPNMSLGCACQVQQSAFKNVLPLSTVLDFYNLLESSTASGEMMRNVAKVLTQRCPWWVASLQCSHPKCLNPGAHWLKETLTIPNIAEHCLLFATYVSNSTSRSFLSW